MKISPYVFIFLLVEMLTLISCAKNGVHSNEATADSNLKTAFIEGFKTISFCKCVEYSSEHDTELLNSDPSCRYPDYLYTVTALIDSIARQESSRIAMETSTMDQVVEGTEGKRVISKCLEFYSSDKLNKIAKEQFSGRSEYWNK